LAGIVCPKCGSAFYHVVDSRQIADTIRRRRECGECGTRYTTYECGNDLMRRIKNRAYEIGYEKGMKKAQHDYCKR
jgi:transcriptional regulator NrdR family protein